MTDKELEVIDLELFKLCFPDVDGHRFGILSDRIICPDLHWVKRFTRSMDSCTEYVVPMMNKRDWRLTVDEYICDGRWWFTCTWLSDLDCVFQYAVDPSLPVALCKSAIKALGE